ncbi:MAG: alpha-ribazole phosphatase [Planctomycetota bacterium]
MSGRRIWLVRHGETEGGSSIRYFGRSDVPLSDAGRRQIRALAPLFGGPRPSSIWHSPLVRARESAEILASSCGFDAALLRADDRLAEIDFGRCEGMTADEIGAAFPEFWARHRRGLADAFPGGESFADLGRRVAAAVDEILEDSAPGPVLIVAHRGTLRCALRHLLSVPAGEPDELSVDLGSLTEVAEDGSIARFNQTGGDVG